MPMQTWLHCCLLATTSFAAWTGKSPGNGHASWIYPTLKSDKTIWNDKNNNHPQRFLKTWTGMNRNYDMDGENQRVHTGRLLLPGWEDHILDRQKSEDAQWKWLNHAKDGNTLSRTVRQLPHPLPSNTASSTPNFIELTNTKVLPATTAANLRATMLRRFAPKSKSNIEAPKYANNNNNNKPRFAQAGLKTSTGTTAQTKAGGADPWWLNPPPWWLPPPPEWGSPPPSVYSPFYSPGSIQQPAYNSPAHNSYPAFTPTPPPY